MTDTAVGHELSRFVIVALCALRYFEVWRFADVSWWWIGGLMVFAFVWFEFIEPLLGLDKRKAHSEDEQRRKARVKKNFGIGKKK
ncbi:TIGR04438 family Trp-rich protein [Pseudoduganella armeniaca]|uniref:TIGR04438 family Trp-rich protein n=1 Tax=Pseudoduganella armeniaca TaxID=2072590 RepID=UPI001E5C09E8|nr:TIGR04438 family Trp-rich protein [Pseudoduganella armeniaca]